MNAYIQYTKQKVDTFFQGVNMLVKVKSFIEVFAGVMSVNGIIIPSPPYDFVSVVGPARIEKTNAKEGSVFLRRPADLVIKW